MNRSGKISNMNYFSSILNHISELVIGVERILGIYHSEDASKNISGISLTYRNNQLVEEQINFKISDSAKKQIEESIKTYNWIDKKQLPFEVENSSRQQLNIFSEENNLVLIIPVADIDNNCNNLIYIYFKEGIDQFGVTHHKSNLSTQNKSIIGHIISHSVKSFATTYLEQENKLKQIVNKTQQILEIQKNKTTNNANNTHIEFIKQWAISILNEISNSDGINYVYSDAALKKILETNQNFEEIKKALLEAFDYAKLISLYQENNEIVIEAEYITFENSLVTPVNHRQETLLSPRLQKTQDLLDKLEKYSLLVAQKKLNLTSFNVGKAMDRPITPAAISDAIAKNKDRINILFDQFPNNWNFIKNNFRPIINIIELNNNRLKNLG